MFEFFIALFGGLYYGGRILSEKSNKYLSNAKWDKYNAISNSISNRDNIRMLEKEFRTNRLDIINELDTELKYILGDNYLDLYNNYRFRDISANEIDKKYHLDSLIVSASQSNSIANIWNLAYMVYLAKNGYTKINWFYTTYFIDGLFGDRSHLLNDAELKEQRMVSIRFGKVIETYLSQKLAGDGAKFFFSTHYSDNIEILEFGNFVNLSSGSKRRPLSDYRDI